MSLSEVQVDKARLLHNVAALRSVLAPGVQMLAVVKGNAYGHGLVEVVRCIESEVDGFQVDDIEELRLLRTATAGRVLVLGFVPVENIEEAIDLGAELTVYDLQMVAAIDDAASRLGTYASVHLKIDALLGRLGVVPRDLSLMIEGLKQHPGVEVLSAYAHFANIEDTTDLGHAYAQIDVFDRCWNALRNAGWPNLGRHISATSGAMTVDSGNDLVRFGLGLYGMYPSIALAERHAGLELKPVMRWVSHLAQVKTLPAHHPVGYGLTFITPREMRIGIVPQGYADGYDRGLSNSGEVLVGGARCSVLGRVAMNMFATDLSDVPAANAGDEVVLLGEQGSERITAEEIATRLGTINYEVTARVSSSLPRVLV